MVGTRRGFGLQSAMEYLMTYGWAILIIAVVLGALFALGIFGGTSLFGGSTCVASPGFLCQSPVLQTNGNLSFTVGQNTGASLYNVGFACSSTALTNGMPNPVYALVLVTNTGAATNALPSGTNTLGGATSLTLIGDSQYAIGTPISSNGITCYQTTPPMGPIRITPSGNVLIGQVFTGYIWMNYTQYAGLPGPTNQYLEQRIGTVTLKVI